MSTDIRPELSRKNPYWISRHRFYELRHFCMQYDEWKAALAAINVNGKDPLAGLDKPKNSGTGDPTYQMVLMREEYTNKIDMVEKAAKEGSPELGNYIFKGVTKGISFDHLMAQDQIPCCKEMYYDHYRRFFWLLSNIRK